MDGHKFDKNKNEKCCISLQVRIKNTIVLVYALAFIEKLEIGGLITN